MSIILTKKSNTIIAKLRETWEIHINPVDKIAGNSFIYLLSQQKNKIDAGNY